ncbi:MAG: hypothetical protein DRP01_00095 [Archaeoglobales archaeon]|nr:MAG: hypothetical protein DRP01_00095 [Archaeoglobales archaeon]
MGITLEQAKAEMHEKMHDGVVCPCCGGKVKVYKRKLSKDMAKFLLMVVSKYREAVRFYATNEVIQGGNKNATDGVYLVHWGLLEKSDDTNRGVQGVGLYRPTSEGMHFAYNETYVPTHAHLLNKKKIGESFDRTNIKGVLGADYEALKLYYLS